MTVEIWLAAADGQASGLQLIVTAVLSAALGGLAAYLGTYTLERRKMLWQYRGELFTRMLPAVFEALDALRDGRAGADEELLERMGDLERAALLTTSFELNWVRALHEDARRLRQEPDAAQREVMRRQLATRVARFNHQVVLALRWRARRIPWPNGFRNRRENYS